MKNGWKMRRIVVMVVVFSLGLFFTASIEPSKAMPVKVADNCPEIVRQALASTDRLCHTVGRNQACYGHIQLQAQSQPGVTDFKFNQEGDIAEVELLQSLHLGAMNKVSEEWGVALMRVQANLPDSLLDKNITLLLFGDVEIQNRMTVISNSLVVTAEATRNVNVRQLPAIDAWVIGTIAPGDQVTATGRVADGSWVRISLPDNGGTGWVASELLASEGDLESLSIADPFSQVYGPMQAFYFTSGQNDSVCAEAPDSGFLVQTPEGVAEVSLLINEVNIQIGSTVYFQAQPGGDMTIRVVEGAAQATAFGTTYRVIAGTQTTIPLDENLNPAGPPQPPTAYDMTEVQALPMSSLERQVQIHPPASPAEVAAVSLPVGYVAAEESQPEEEVTVTPTPGASDVSPTPSGSEEIEKITICHNGNTITINPDALDAHLKQGDTIGPCP